MPGRKRKRDDAYDTQAVLHALYQQLPFETLYANAMAEYKRNAAYIQRVLREHRSLAVTKQALAEEERRRASGLNKPWQRRMRAEAKDAYRHGREQARTLLARTDEDLVEERLAAFAVESSTLEERLRGQETELETRCAGAATTHTGTGGSLSSPTTVPSSVPGLRGSDGARASVDLGGDITTVTDTSKTTATSSTAAAVYHTQRMSWQRRAFHALQDLTGRILQEFYVVPKQAWVKSMNVCSCGTAHEMIASSSAMICPRCEKPLPFLDTFRPDEDTVIRRVGVTKASKSNRLKMFILSLEIVMNRETWRIPDWIMKRLAVELIARGYDDPETLDPQVVYQVSKEIKKSVDEVKPGNIQPGKPKGKKTKTKAFPNHFPQAWSRLTGKTCPQLSSVGLHKVLMLFCMLNEQHDRIHYNWMGREVVKCLSHVGELPEEERAMYRAMLPFFRMNEGNDTKTSNYTKLEKMKYRLGVDTTKKGLVLRDSIE